MPNKWLNNQGKQGQKRLEHGRRRALESKGKSKPLRLVHEDPIPKREGSVARIEGPRGVVSTTVFDGGLHDNGIKIEEISAQPVEGILGIKIRPSIIPREVKDKPTSVIRRKGEPWKDIMQRVREGPRNTYSRERR